MLCTIVHIQAYVTPKLPNCNLVYKTNTLIMINNYTASQTMS